MKKLIAIAVGVLALVAGAVGMVNADPGPNDSNNHGLCTAYFNGQKNGHNPEDQPPPFQALEDAAREQIDGDGFDNDGDGEIDEGSDTPNNPDDDENTSMSDQQAIIVYCDGNISGNTDHGRFTCTADLDPVKPGPQPECTDNPSPGNS